MILDKDIHSTPLIDRAFTSLVHLAQVSISFQIVGQFVFKFIGLILMQYLRVTRVKCIGLKTTTISLCPPGLYLSSFVEVLLGVRVYSSIELFRDWIYHLSLICLNQARELQLRRVKLF